MRWGEREIGDTGDTGMEEIRFVVFGVVGLGLDIGYTTKIMGILSIS